jgi:metallo-beta-lactamase class B
MNVFAPLALLLALVAGCSRPLPLPAQDFVIAHQNPLTRIAGQVLRWDEPAEPEHIFGPIHFVGTQSLAAWLIKATDDDYILLNTGTQRSGPLIEASIRKKVDPRRIKLLLAGHAHFDHVGGHAHIKKIADPDVRVAMFAEDVPRMTSGGIYDFRYGNVSAFLFDPVKVTEELRDGQDVCLRDTCLTALKTAGHTEGSTTFMMKVVERGKAYRVVFLDGTGVNPGYRVLKQPSYPKIARDYCNTFRLVASWTPDLWFTAHNEMFDFEGKRARAAREGIGVWAEGYREFVERERGKFAAQMALEAEPGEATPCR